MDEKNISSDFLWKAAMSTVDSCPLIAANLLLKCKKVHKIDKRSICQSCGNHWNLGNYRIKIQKTYKSSTIKKIKRRSSKNGTGGCDMQKMILKRYSKCASAIMIQCLMCKKSTSISIPLPPKTIMKTTETVTQPELPFTQKIENKDNKKKKKKKIKQNTAGLKIPNTSSTNSKNITAKPKASMETSQFNSNSNTTSKKSAKKSTFTKAQMKAISQSLNKGQPKSSLQAFLNSVR